MCVFSTHAQNEANIWYFGNQAGIDFNNGNPEILLDGQLNTNEGCATISDTDGNLLFYTDGRQVYNRNHFIMPNGDDLKGDSSSTHSAIIVPNPSNSNIYYIFTVDEEAGPDGLNYSEVDITLNGGLGDVTTNKNILLTTPTTEKLTAIRNATDDGFWVVSHAYESNDFLAYQVTNAGVSITPIISSVGTFIGGNDFSVAIGAIKISPDGTKLAVARGEGLSEVQLFDFNDATGIVSNSVTIMDLADDEMVYGVEFSPNSDLLYVSVTGNGVFQYNLGAGDASEIIASQFEITSLPRPYAGMQIAPDGRIYIAKFNQPRIDYIENPNIIGVGCDFQFEAFELDGGISRSGLPPFIQTFFNIGFTYENVCQGNATQFNANISAAYDNIVWDFGDGETSMEENPAHIYTNPNTYSVSLTVTIGGQTISEIRHITIYDQPIANTPENINICDIDNDGFSDFNLTQITSEVLDGQDEGLFELEFYTSLANLNSNTPILNPTIYQNVTPFLEQEIFVKIFNSQNQECFDITSFTIQTFYKPDPSPNIPVLGFCDNTSIGNDSDGQIIFDLTAQENFLFNGIPELEIDISYFQDLALTIPILDPTSYVNTNEQESIYVQLVNVNNSTCTIVTSFPLEVYQLPTVQTSVVLSQCDDDTDGFSVFNLQEVTNEISINADLETITFHESEQEAINDINQISPVIAYQNQVVSTDQIWARIENDNNCYRTSEIQLLVSTTQIPLDFTREFYECDDAVNGDTQDGISTFDFSIVTQEIEALFPMGQQLVITYYQNVNDALSEINAIVDIANYRNEMSPEIQNIYIRVDSLLDNDCLGLGEHITLHVETMPIANTITIGTLCDDDGDGFASFDTSTIENELLQGQTDVNITYTDQLGNILSNPLPNPFLTATQNITATVTNQNSQDPDGGCMDETIISFQVEAAAAANAIPVQQVCDDNDDGAFDFDTSDIELTVLNGQTGMIVTYFTLDGTILSSPLPNPFTTTTQDIVVRVENQLSETCFDETTLSFIVNDQPEAFSIMDHYVCDDVSNNQEAAFILPLYDTEILGEQSDNIFDVLYYASSDDAQNGVNQLPNSYINTSNPQEIHARIENNQNPDCFDVTSFEIGIYRLPIAHDIEDVDICDIENDGEEEIILSDYSSLIINGQENTNIHYYFSQLDADNNVNILENNFTLNTVSIQIYARVESTISPDCFTTTSFDINMREQPEIDLESTYYICDNDSITLSISNSYDSYNWSTGETSQSINIDSSGNYSVTVSNLYGDFICEEVHNFQVIQSGIATITEVIVADFTQNDNSIEILVEGLGDYEYSVDGFTWQDSNLFTNLSIQPEYIVQARDKNGCGTTFEIAYLLYAPKFFTPNDDGYHDTWNIVNFNRESGGTTYIFDRYGKLLTTLRAGSIGWDGAYNGGIMPSNAYWYRYERGNGQVFLGHFSLIKRGK
ncbi:T9SS type B sorting domain-containing protein [Dokdonia ponticola]|uniref:T9SS type B sorting domain-containing protein n=1 Tax=Dokdonia ponticola TaxID=2041041 RepID=A0ABV9HXS4_9FLAO